MTWHNMIWLDTIWHNTIWHNTIWYDTIWCNTVWCNMTWLDTILGKIAYFGKRERSHGCQVRVWPPHALRNTWRACQGKLQLQTSYIDIYAYQYIYSVISRLCMISNWQTSAFMILASLPSWIWTTHIQAYYYYYYYYYYVTKYTTCIVR